MVNAAACAAFTIACERNRQKILKSPKSSRQGVAHYIEKEQSYLSVSGMISQVNVVLKVAWASYSSTRCVLVHRSRSFEQHWKLQGWHLSQLQLDFQSTERSHANKNSQGSNRKLVAAEQRVSARQARHLGHLVGTTIQSSPFDTTAALLHIFSTRN